MEHVYKFGTQMTCPEIFTPGLHLYDYSRLYLFKVDDRSYKMKVGKRNDVVAWERGDYKSLGFYP